MTPDLNVVNDSDTETTAIVMPCYVKTQVRTVHPVVAGADLIYQLDVTNLGLATARSVVLQRRWRCGTNFVSAASGRWR